jgi:hypothetical protein
LIVSKHTEGPWRADDNGDGTSCITAGRGCDVADTRASVDEPANARLIAAAPELLAALDLAETYLDDGAPASALRVIKTTLANIRD